MKKALILGGGGFIGGHMARNLKSKGYFVRAVDLKRHEWFDGQEGYCDEFIVGDLREWPTVELVLDDTFDEVYQFAADMGGAGFVFTGENDYDIMHNSAMINLHVTKRLIDIKETTGKAIKTLYSSSACIYPEYNQMDADKPVCAEDTAYPANPDSEYGWEKLFSERMFIAAFRNYGLDARIVRFHNIFGPYGTWDGGREKAPAAFCRKIARAPYEGSTIEMWGDGEQTRSFLYIDECIEGVNRLMESNLAAEPLNIGSEEMVSINKLAEYVAQIAGKEITIKHIPGPLGVRGRNSDNKLVKERLGWEPTFKLYDGLVMTYLWINQQVRGEEG